MQRIPKVKQTAPRNVQNAITYVREFLAGVATNPAFPALNAPTPPTSNSKVKSDSNAKKKERLAKFVKFMKGGGLTEMVAKLIASDTPPTYTQIDDAMDALQTQQDIVKIGSSKSDTSLRNELYNVLFAPVEGLIPLAAAYVQAQSGTDISTIQSSNLGVTATQINPITVLGQPNTPAIVPLIIKPKPKKGSRNTIPPPPVSGCLVLKVVARDPKATSYIYKLVQVDENDQPVEDGESYSQQEQQSKYKFTRLTPGLRYKGTVIAKASRANVISTESEPAFAYCP